MQNKHKFMEDFPERVAMTSISIMVRIGLARKGCVKNFWEGE
jgi:hypothetical protein